MKNTKTIIQNYILEKMTTTNIHTIKVKELTSDLHISRSTFYLYYDSIYSVLQEIEDNFFELFYEVTAHLWWFPLDSKYCSEPHPILLHTAQFLRKYQRTLIILWGPYGDTQFQYKIRKIAEKNFFPPEIGKSLFPINTKYHINYRIGGLMELMNYWLLYDCTLSDRELCTMIYKLMFSVT